jgi:hypothetical protein
LWSAFKGSYRITICNTKLIPGNYNRSPSLFKLGTASQSTVLLSLLLLPLSLLLLLLLLLHCF